MLQIIKLIYCIFSSCGLTLVTTWPPTASTGTTPPSTTARGSRKMERPTATSSSFLLWVKTPKHACNQRNLLDKNRGDIRLLCRAPLPVAPSTALRPLPSTTTSPPSPSSPAPTSAPMSARRLSVSIKSLLGAKGKEAGLNTNYFLAAEAKICDCQAN